MIATRFGAQAHAAAQGKVAPDMRTGPLASSLESAYLDDVPQRSETPSGYPPAARGQTGLNPNPPSQI